MKKREKPVAVKARPENKKEGAAASPASGVAKSALALGGKWLGLSLLAVMAVGAALYFLTVSGPATLRAGQYTETLLGNAADRIEQQLTFIRSRLTVAAGDSTIAAAFTAADPATLMATEQTLARQFPEVLGIRLLAADWHELDMNSSLPISNVTLDLLRQARQKKPVQVELVLPGKPRQHIALIEPVKVNNEIVGFVLAGMKLEVLQQALAGTQGSPGYLELSQDFSDAAQTVASRGDNSLKSGVAAPYSRDLAGAPWKLAYWPTAEEGATNSTLEITYWGSLALLLLAVGGAGVMLIRTLDQAQHQDAARLLKALLDARSSDGKLAPERYDLAVFKDMAVTLARHEWAGKAQAAANAAAAAAAPVNALPATGSQPVLAAPEAGRIRLNAEIFRAYDIRGVVGDSLTAEVVKQIGRAIGSEAFDRGEQKIVIARDGRLSGPELLTALKQGLLESGRDVVDLGAVPTPLLYFATHYLSTRSGVMLTGSHNPSEYNGLKIVIAGETLAGDDIQRLRERIENGNLLSGRGSSESLSINEDYIAQITGDIALAQPLKVVIDCGNGIAGAVAPTLYKALGCEVVELFCDVDGRFPNHHPDPSKPENLKKLIATVLETGADIGLAFDGDGDRLGVIDSTGKIIWADRQLMLYSMDVLSRHPGTDIIYDVKCSRHLARVITGHGGRPLMWRTGHSFIKAKMRETGALLAGEQSGHIFFKERWFGFDDAIYTGARLLEILAADFRKSADIFKSLPEGVSTPELNMTISEQRKFAFVDRLAKQGQFAGGQINTTDGIRVDFSDGWGLVRASNTTPSLVIRFEADTDAALIRIQELFRGQMLAIDPAVQLPF
ncbi:phosphomannomutase/phosphoglucomutase [Permianibacter fluminis]|uniref:phosphomannomutase/phosphoglucomutase n=1 Tax=Permianibacter fluminis TaxID=2738515 RepID=UPI002E2E14F0|nr:phosphomannomutase/phosphoglucomutase [Permianibacter fluminis]